MNKMKAWYCISNLWTVIVVLVLAVPTKWCRADSTSNSNSSTTASSLLSAIKIRLLERRQLDTINIKNKNRKLIEAFDLSSAVNGQYIIIFDPDSVSNATEKSMQLFTKSQISYVFDNIAIKGVAIRNVTTQMLYELEADIHILSIEPVRENTQPLERFLSVMSRCFAISHKQYIFYTIFGTRKLQCRMTRMKSNIMRRTI